MKRLALAIVLAGAYGCAGKPSAGPSPMPVPPRPAIASTPAELPEPGPTASVSQRGLPLADVEIRRGDRSFLRLAVEIAETPQAQETGLMNIKKLSDASGEAFVFPAPVGVSFYMKDTLIPLDIAFWDADGKVLQILQMQPCNSDPCPLFKPAAPYATALEVNAGLFARNGVMVGDSVSLKPRR